MPSSVFLAQWANFWGKKRKLAEKIGKRLSNDISAYFLETMNSD